jgi:putative ABC transport system permease protein
VNELFRDFRHAVRVLRRRPGFTVTAALTIGLGVAATTALYSVVHATLIEPLPFADADRLAIVWGVAGAERDVRGASPPEVMDWRSMSSRLEDVSIYDQTNPTLSGAGGAARQLDAETVSAGYFALLGVTPVLGRAFTEAEEQPGSGRVVVIGNELWRNELGGSRSVLGSTLTIDERAHTIVGVLPQGFRGVAFDTEVWLPLVATVADADAVDLVTSRGGRWLGALTKLRPGVTWEAAQADLDRVAADLARAYPNNNRDRGAMLVPLRDFYLDATRLLLLILLGAVGLLFAIAAVNVTNLQLVRASSRVDEVALRFALGGSRSRIVRQLVVEGLVLAAIGGGIGLVAAVWGVQAFLPLVPAGVLPVYADIDVDAGVALLSVALAALCGTVSAAIPALRATRRDPGRRVVATGRATAGGGLHGRWGLQHVLVAGEVALALMILVGAALMARSFREQRRIEPGFVADDVVVARVQLPQAGYDADARRAFVERLLAEVRALPGVDAAAIAFSAPLRGFGSATILQREGNDDERIRYYRHAITPDYFAALRIPIVRGRAFAPADAATTDRVVIVGAETARRFWPDLDPIGRRLRLGTGESAPVATVVGVAGDVRMRGLTTSPTDPTDDPDIYLPYPQLATSSFDVVVRAAGDAAPTVAGIRAALARIDANLALYLTEPLGASLAAETATDRFGSSLLGIFGALALLLAAVGVYGVMAFYVGTRAREIAIRMAIGAAPGAVRRLVLGRGLAIVGGGIVAGLIGAVIASRFVASLLYGITPTDPLTYALVAFVLLAVAAVANALPAFRATRIPPQTTLRAE